MRIRWDIAGRGPVERTEAEFRKAAADARFYERIDAVSLGGLVLAVAALGLLLTLIVGVLDRAGALDPPLVRPLADPRILTNLRDDLTSHPILDAILHAPEGSLYVAQHTGLIHRYDPSSGLWTTDRPFDTGQFVNPDLVQLRSGCGDDPRSDRAADCPDPDTIWGLTGNGGLARRVRGQWETVVRDTTFVGADGMPVEGSQLSAAATSADGKWLVVGTHGQGIGIYDLERHDWLTLQPDWYTALPTTTVTHLAWAQDRFWLGSPAGLATLQMHGGDPRLSNIQSVIGEVLDLDVDEDVVVILQRRPCADGMAGCLWLGRLARADREPEIVMAESTRYPSLSLADLNYAQYSGRHLSLAGKAGIFDYDLTLHAWRRLSDRQATAFISQPNETGFYYGFAGGVGEIQGHEMSRTWPIPNEHVTKLLYGRTDEVLALTEAGSLFSVQASTSATPTTVFDAAGTTLNPVSFTAAIATGDVVLFLGPEGALLHDSATRTYEDVPRSSIPDWLESVDSQVISAGDTVYSLLSPTGNPVRVYTLQGSKLASTASFIGEVENAQARQVPGPVQHTWKWDSQSLGLLLADGRAYHLTPTDITQTIAGPEPALDSVLLLDAAAIGQDLAVVTWDGLRVYNAGEREWSSIAALPEGEHAVEIAALNGQALLLTDLGRIVTPGSTGSSLVGDRRGFQIGDSGLSDARRVEQDLYLAGDGWVERYDMAARAITARWQVATGGAAKLAAIIDDQPLALAGGRATLGDTAIDAAAGPVIEMGVSGGTIWTMRENQGRRYLKGYGVSGGQVSGGAQCYFRRPTSGADVTQIVDARALPSGLVAVATNAGLKFYDPSSRSWFDAPNGLAHQAGRLYLVNETLVFVQEIDGETHLLFGPVADVQVPDSCGDQPVQMRLTFVQARAAAVDESAGRMAWIDLDGKVVEWQAGRQQTRLGPDGTGPTQTQLRRVYGRGSYLLATTDDSIWHYDLDQRTWSSYELFLPDSAGAWADANIEQDGAAETIVVKTQAGSFYLGSFQPDQSFIHFELINTPGTAFGHPADLLLDVQGRGDEMWTFVLKDRLKIYDPVSRTWQPDVMLDTLDASLWYGTLADRGLVVGNGGNSWWVEREPGQTPLRFDRYDLNPGEQTGLDDQGHIWRLTSTGQLIVCSRPFGDADCQTHSRQPYYLDPARIRHAYAWQELLLFDTDAGLQALSPSTGQPVQLPPEAADFAGATTARQIGTAAWFYRPGELLILHQTTTGVSAERLAGIRSLAIDSSGTPWARFDDDWRRWAQIAFEPPRLPGGQTAQEAGLCLFPSDGLPTAGLDATGIPLTWGTGLASESSPLPAAIDPARVTALFRVAQGKWWVQAGATLYRVEAGTCTAPVTSPITPTVPITPGAPPPPTATPAVVACFQVTGSVELPANFVGADATAIALARLSSDGMLQLTSLDSVTVDIIKSAPGRYQVQANSYPPPNVPAPLVDQWATLVNNVKQVGNGQWAYDPFLTLTVSSQGTLIAQSPGGVETLGNGGITPIRRAALDAGWLRWDGANGGGFIVNSPGGSLAYAKDRFIIDGRLLFEDVDAILASSAGRLYAANRHGVWTFDQSLSLAEPSITFQPVRLDAPLTAAHGRLMAANGDWLPGSAQTQPSQAIHQFQIDDIIVSEEVGSRRVEATVPIQGSPALAFAAQGFVWDLDRHGLAYTDAGLILQSAAGIGPITRLSTLDAGPNGIARAGAQLRFENSAGILLYDNGAWYRLSGGAWQAIGDPLANRFLVQNVQWTWQLQGSQLAIALAGSSHRFGLVAEPDGYGFTSDLLQAAAIHDGDLYVMTNAFLERATDAHDLGALFAPRYAPLATDALEVLSVADSKFDLFHRAGTAVSRWDAAQNQFTPVSAAANPYDRRLLVDSNRLRFIYHGGRIVKELIVDDITGQQVWTEFAFDRGQFPFDRVHSVAAFDGRLYLGTASGLEVFGPGNSLGLSDVAAFYRLSTSAASALTDVDRVGTPRDDPGLLMARGPAGCIEQRGAGPLAPCHDLTLLDWRLRAETDLWQWVGGPSGTVEGYYRDVSGDTTTAPAVIRDGRFPHDQLHDVAVCGDQAFTLWRNGWLTAHPDDNLGLAAGLLNYSPSAALPSRFVCVEREIVAAQWSVPPGLYIEQEDGSISRYAAPGWTEVADPAQVAAIIERADRPPILDRARLRLLQSSGDSGLTFEQRTLADQWLPLAWETGCAGIDRACVAIDVWREVIAQDDALWAATPAGLVRFNRHSLGRAQVDLDTLLVVREPAGTQAPCLITDLALSGGQVLARCGADPSQVYQGQIDGSRDGGVFQPRPGTDPFAEQILINQQTDGRWVWQLQSRASGSPGHLAATLNGVQVTIRDGRFTFDTVNSLAFFQSGVVEIGTDAGGWLEAPRDDLSALSLTRSPISQIDAAQVTRVAIMWSGGELGLCLRNTAGDYTRLKLSGGIEQAERCPEYLADDGFWQYSRSDSVVSISAEERGVGGSGGRRLQQGRFTDDMVVGLPLTGLDGEAAVYWIPTRAGVLQLDQSLAYQAIHLPPFAGLPADASPSALVTLDTLAPAYLGSDALYTLGPPRSPAGRLPQPVDSPDSRLELTGGPGTTLLLQGTAESQAAWCYLDGTSLSPLQCNSLAVDLSEMEQFKACRLQWGSPEPWLLINLSSDRPTIEQRDPAGSVALDLPADLPLVAPALYVRDHIFLFARQEAYDISLRRAMTDSFGPCR